MSYSLLLDSLLDCYWIAKITMPGVVKSFTPPAPVSLHDALLAKERRENLEKFAHSIRSKRQKIRRDSLPASFTGTKEGGYSPNTSVKSSLAAIISKWNSIPSLTCTENYEANCAQDWEVLRRLYISSVAYCRPGTVSQACAGWGFHNLLRKSHRPGPDGRKWRFITVWQVLQTNSLSCNNFRDEYSMIKKFSVLNFEHQIAKLTLSNNVEKYISIPMTTDTVHYYEYKRFTVDAFHPLCSVNEFFEVFQFSLHQLVLPTPENRVLLYLINKGYKIKNMQIEIRNANIFLARLALSHVLKSTSMTDRIENREVEFCDELLKTSLDYIEKIALSVIEYLESILKNKFIFENVILYPIPQKIKWRIMKEMHGNMLLVATIQDCVNLTPKNHEYIITSKLNLLRDRVMKMIDLEIKTAFFSKLLEHHKALYLVHLVLAEVRYSLTFLQTIQRA